MSRACFLILWAGYGDIIRGSLSEAPPGHENNLGTTPAPSGYIPVTNNGPATTAELLTARNRCKFFWSP